MSAERTPHSEQVAKARTRIEATKTMDMVSASELRGWLAKYVSLEEQLEALQKKLYHAGDMCCRPVGTCVDAEWFTPIVAQPSSPASERLS